MSCLFSNFTGQTLKTFGRAKELTGNWTDLYLDFGKAKIVFYEPFTIPFTKTATGLKRFKNWLKPPEVWKETFVGHQLVNVDLQTYEKDICLEFNEGLVLLSNKRLMGLFHGNRCLWSTYEMEIFKDA